MAVPDAESGETFRGCRGLSMSRHAFQTSMSDGGPVPSEVLTIATFEPQKQKAAESEQSFAQSERTVSSPQDVRRDRLLRLAQRFPAVTTLFEERTLSGAFCAVPDRTPPGVGQLGTSGNCHAQPVHLVVKGRPCAVRWCGGSLPCRSPDARRGWLSSCMPCRPEPGRGGRARVRYAGGVPGWP